MTELSNNKIKTFDQKKWLKENLSYHKDSGSWAWIYHRISGIALIGYLFLHIYSLSPLTQGKEPFQHKMQLYSTPFFMVLEWLLFIVVLFHSLNGIRIVLVDWAEGAKYQKQLYRFTWVIGIILFFAMGIIMFSRELLKFFGK
jgi:succinate dehydrogenase / fumarate reductase cytochrome b subunit